MCDTLAVLPAETRYDFGLFAKNSDRPPNEAQYLDWIPAGSHLRGQSLRCTHIDIPQSPQTHAVVLSRPFWMWGGEMGVNQHGLAIGNEAIFSRVPPNKEPALLGMDLLRLALERAQTAAEGVDVITNLLEEYGQGGVHIQEGHPYYHNSFLIADSQECWVLETVNKHWAARKTSSLYSISNLLSLETDWDRSSKGLEEFMQGKGRVVNRGEPNLSADLSDLIFTTFADGGRRCARSRELMARDQGRISIKTMASILRDHRGKKDPRPGLAGADICMHASLGPIRISQTTGSLIVYLAPDAPLIFATGSAAPCTGVFKPFWVDTAPGMGKRPDGCFDPESLFWSHELLHREVLQNYPERLASYRDERDSLEEEFIQGAFGLQGAGREERKAFSETCLKKASEAEQRWLEIVKKIPPKPVWPHKTAWMGFNRSAQLDLS